MSEDGGVSTSFIRAVADSYIFIGVCGPVLQTCSTDYPGHTGSNVVIFSKIHAATNVTVWHLEVFLCYRDIF